jgi:hypothetical protein
MLVIIPGTLTQIEEFDVGTEFNPPLKKIAENEFLDKATQGLHAKQRACYSNISHELYLKIIEEFKLTLVEVEYKIRSKIYSFSFLVTPKVTPRSIYCHALSDYQNRNIETVKMPYYNDDEDIYRASNIKIEIIWNDQFCQLPSMHGKSKKEVKEFFKK